MKFLPRNEVNDLFEAHKEIQVNQTVRMNHSTSYCSGESNSLSIMRKDDGTLVMYCHRCGKLGIVVENFARVFAAKRKDTTIDRQSEFIKPAVTIPPRSHQEFDRWPIRARHWYRKYGITDSEAKKYGFHFDEESRRVIIPIYSGGELISFQKRKIFDEDELPKYLTITKDREKSFWKGEDREQDFIVLTEDVLSAIKVNRTYNSVALTGINIFDSLMNYLSNYKKFYIWLDNDNPTVKMRQIDLKNRLSLWGEVRIIKTNKDPKDHSEEEIVEIISGI